MEKTNKFSNLNRVNFKNKCAVLKYLIKTAMKIHPSVPEREAYHFYNYLINADAYLAGETPDHYQVYFKDNPAQKIIIRKPPSSDSLVFRQIFIYKEYLPVTQLYKENFGSQHPVNIIDAGSNIGLTTLFFQSQFNNINCVSVEPEPGNFKILEHNIKNIGSNITPVNAAIWNKSGKIKIVNDFRDKSDWAFRVEKSDDADALQAYTINDLIGEYGFESIDILKIDIEGSEKQLFDKEISDLSFLSITKCIAIEIHDEFNCREDINTILAEYGFSFFREGESTIGINRNLNSPNF